MAKEQDKSDNHLWCNACDFQKLKRMENNPTVRELRDKIEQLNFKLTECRNENQVLKRNLHAARQTVCKEVGAYTENFQTLLKHGGDPGWKERAENVLLLRTKVRELQEHLDELEGNPVGPHESPSEEFAKKSLPSDRKAFWRMELERRLAMESTEKELSPITQECNELRKKLDSEKTRYRDLNREVNLLRAELQSQVDKNEEEMGLAQSFAAIEGQLQDTLTERAQTREQLVGFKARNKNLEDEISVVKGELQILHTKAKNNNMLIDTLTNKHKQIQEAIEAEKTIVRQNVDRYKDDLRQLKENHEEDVKMMDTLQSMVQEKNKFIDDLEKDLEKGGEYSEEDRGNPESNFMRSNAGSSEKDDVSGLTYSKSTELKTAGSGVQSSDEADKCVQSSSEQTAQQMTIACAKYKALIEAAQMESDRLSFIASLQEKQMNDIAMEVVETGRLVMMKNVEKKQLLEKTKKIQDSLVTKKIKSNSSAQFKFRLEELMIKIEAQKEENDFLKSFLKSALDNKFKDIYLYQSFVSETKEFLTNRLQEITDTVNEKKDLPQTAATLYI